MKTCITCTYYASTDEILHGCSRVAKVEAFIDVGTGEDVNRIALRSCRVERFAGAPSALLFASPVGGGHVAAAGGIGRRPPSWAVGTSLKSPKDPRNDEQDGTYVPCLCSTNSKE